MDNMHHADPSTPIPLAQLLAWLHDRSTQEKKVILRELMDDTAALTLASAPSLAKDWDDEDEHEAWKDL